MLDGGATRDPSATVGRRRHLQPLWAFGALAWFGSGLWLAWHHPLWPLALAAMFALWMAVSARWPGLWLFAIPAALPLLNFSPWTGWLTFDESDLLILGTLAGEFGRQAVDAETRSTTRRDGFDSEAGGLQNTAPVVALAALALVGLLRGLADAGASFRWFDGYADPANTLRVSKGLIFAIAFWPLLRKELQASVISAMNRLARGTQVGLAIVGLAVLWERAAYPGVLDFSTHYRTTAMFWEMHVGGGAIDAYLALATPFAAWGLWTATTRGGWAAAAALALLSAHACLTTFSRGAYVGVILPLALLACAWWWRRFRVHPQAAAVAAAAAIFLALLAAVVLLVGTLALGYGGTGLALLGLLSLLLAWHWRTPSMRGRRAAAMALAVALLTEAVAVLGGGTFMRVRVDASEGDLAARLAHWRAGIELLKSPTDVLLGIGSGRLPSRYSREVRNGEFSGSVAVVPEALNRQVARLSGPRSDAGIAGMFALTQRVSLEHRGAYRVGLLLRAAQPTDVAVDVCEEHLLYARRCQGALFRVQPAEAWQHLEASLEGPDLSRGRWYAPRLGVFAVTVRNAGVSVDIAEASLRTRDGTELLLNRRFTAGLGRWLPSAEAHFLPWHIDNLFLELLIERGMLGLGAFFLLLAYAFRSLRRQTEHGFQIAPFLAASLLGVLLVGAVSSVLDVARIAFLFLIVLVASLQFPPLRSPRRRSVRRLPSP